MGAPLLQRGPGEVACEGLRGAIVGHVEHGLRVEIDDHRHELEMFADECSSIPIRRPATDGRRGTTQSPFDDAVRFFPGQAEPAPPASLR
jgi:hypothetical protein